MHMFTVWMPVSFIYIDVYMLAYLMSFVYFRYTCVPILQDGSRCLVTSLMVYVLLYLLPLQIVQNVFQVHISRLLVWFLCEKTALTVK